MAVDYQRGGYRPFSTGQVLSRTFATIGDNPAVTFGTVFLVVSLPLSIMHYAYGTFVVPAVPGSLTGGLVGMLAMLLLGSVLDTIAVGVLVRATVAAQLGARTAVQDTIRPAAARPVALAAVGLLCTGGLWAGSAAFIVPGIILMLMWSVVVPVLIEEKTGIFVAFGRSRQLTSGHRATIFGVQIVVGILTALIAVSLSFLSFTLFGGSPLGQLYSLNLGVAGIELISKTVTLGMSATVHSILYVELVERKGGSVGDALSSIFE